MRGRLTAYLRYQLADFLLLRAALPVILVLFFAFMTLKTTPDTVDWASPSGGARQLNELFRILAGMFIVLGSFIGVARLVTDDRSNGYFRFLFSKPVSVERFYFQQWVLHGVGFVAIVGLLGVWLQALTAHVPVGGAMMVMALTWTLVGGVGFALSAATNYDALLLVVGYVASSVLHSIKAAPAAHMAPWLRQVTRLTLPVQKLDYVRDQLYGGQDIPWPAAIHVVAYGTAGLVAALVILRRASFAR